MSMSTDAVARTHADEVFVEAGELGLTLDNTSESPPLATRIAAFEKRLRDMLDEAFTGIPVTWLPEGSNEKYTSNPTVCNFKLDLIAPAATVRAWVDAECTLRIAQLRVANVDPDKTPVRIYATIHTCAVAESIGQLYMRFFDVIHDAFDEIKTDEIRALNDKLIQAQEDVVATVQNVGSKRVRIADEDDRSSAKRCKTV